MKRIILALVLLMSCARVDIADIRREAEQFATHVQGATSTDCADADTDGDGYVSCTIFRGDKDPLPIQCGSQNYGCANRAHGCKYVPAIKVQ
jgi:hypothetical protein